MIHSGGDYMSLQHWNGGALRFFILQGLVITVEEMVKALAVKGGVNLLLPSKLWRAIGYFWVLLWFSYSFPIWLDPLKSVGLGHSRPTPLTTILSIFWCCRMQLGTYNIEDIFLSRSYVTLNIWILNVPNFYKFNLIEIIRLMVGAPKHVRFFNFRTTWQSSLPKLCRIRLIIEVNLFMFAWWDSNSIRCRKHSRCVTHAGWFKSKYSNLLSGIKLIWAEVRPLKR